MQFNLFHWIREGVKRSVIAGVSDAVDAIGTPVADDAIKGHLGQMLESTGTATTTRPGVIAGKRRLGRSLKELDGNG